MGDSWYSALWKLHSPDFRNRRTSERILFYSPIRINFRFGEVKSLAFSVSHLKVFLWGNWGFFPAWGWDRDLDYPKSVTKFRQATSPEPSHFISYMRGICKWLERTWLLLKFHDPKLMLPGLAGLINKITERVLGKRHSCVWVAAMFKGHSKGSGLYMCDFTNKNLSRTPLE